MKIEVDDLGPNTSVVLTVSVDAKQQLKENDGLQLLPYVTLDQG